MVLNDRDIEDYINKNIKLMYKVLHRFNLFNDPEAHSLGLQAFYDAVTTYSKDRNATISTYATVLIFNRVGTYARHLSTQKYKNRPLSIEAIADSITEPTGTTSTAESNLLKSPENIQKNLEDTEMCLIARAKMDDIISSMKQGLKKQIVSEWWYEHEGQCTKQSLAVKYGCQPSYVRKVLKEVQDTMIYELRFWRN